MKALTCDEGIEQIRPILKSNKLLLFAGSGVSVASPTNLPTWEGILDKFIEFCEQLQKDLPDDKKFFDLLDDAKTKKAKEPAKVIEVLKDELVKLDSEFPWKNINMKFLTWFSGLFSSAIPNDNHIAIVSTNYQQILTSNYDNCLEEAAYNLGFNALSINSFRFNDLIEKIASNIYNNKPSIIHIHGKIDSVLNNMIFTYKDYVTIKRYYAGFSLVLQSLFLSYSILFVGYGASDPHLEDLIDDITYALNFSTQNDLPKIFMVLPKKEIDEVTTRHKDIMRTKIISVDDYSQVTSLLQNLQSIKPRKREK